jgi:hypothetical protein
MKTKVNLQWAFIVFTLLGMAMGLIFSALIDNISAETDSIRTITPTKVDWSDSTDTASIHIYPWDTVTSIGNYYERYTYNENEPLSSRMDTLLKLIRQLSDRLDGLVKFIPNEWPIVEWDSTNKDSWLNYFRGYTDTILAYPHDSLFRSLWNTDTLQVNPFLTDSIR